MSAVTTVDMEIIRGVARDRELGRIGDGDAEVASQAEARIECEYQRLAALPPGRYDFERRRVADDLGISVGALDAEVKARRKKPDTDTSGHAVMFDEPEPWIEPVDGAALLEEILGIVNRFVVLPVHASRATALWVLHTWTHDSARVSPILAVTSPEKRCGKTTLLEILGTLVCRPLPSSNITTAAVFRTIEQLKPTLLIDEADTFISNADELRGVLNSGHRRRSAYVVRTVGDNHEPRQFRTWAPKSIALIGKLPSTLTDRSITIALRRRGPGETVDRYREEQFTEPRRKAARWSDDYADELKTARPYLPRDLHDRAADNWEPLFAIADAAGGVWPEQARNAAQALSGDPDESKPTMLLEDLRRIFDEQQGLDRISSAILCTCLADMEDRPWPEWRQGKPISPRQLARLLAPFGIVPGTKRQGAATFKGYDRAQFEEAWDRYLPPAGGVTASQPTQDGASGNLFPVTSDTCVTARNEPKPAKDGTCDGVTAEQPPKPEDNFEEGEA